MHRILIVEDEASIARFLELELTHEGYEVDIASDGRAGYEKGISDCYSLIILDLMLPFMSGIEVCRRIRKGHEIPIIMLTAKDDIPDKVMGLDSGANDYMTKPFAIEELLARIRNLLRQVNNSKNRCAIEKIASGKLIIELDKYRVLYDDEEIAMTKKEFQLLEYLMRNKNIVIQREKLIENVWGFDFCGDTNITDVYIRYLRSKIDDKYKVKFIHTVRGVGYQFRDDATKK